MVHWNCFTFSTQCFYCTRHWCNYRNTHCPVSHLKPNINNPAFSHRTMFICTADAAEASLLLRPPYITHWFKNMRACLDRLETKSYFLWIWSVPFVFLHIIYWCCHDITVILFCSEVLFWHERNRTRPLFCSWDAATWWTAGSVKLTCRICVD